MSPILYTILIIILFYAAKLLSPILLYFKRKGEYAHIPQYNKEKSKSLMPSMLMSQDNGWYKMVETMKDKQGKIRPIVHWGPFLDFSHTVAVADATAIREVLLNDTIFIKHPKLYNPLMRVVGDGIITAMDDNWKTQRRLLTPVFHFTTLKAMIPDMNHEAQRMVEEIKRRTTQDKTDSSIDVISLFNDITLSVIIKIAFGNEFNVPYMKDQWTCIFHGLAKSCLYYSLLGSWWTHAPLKTIREFETAKENIKHKCLQVIREKRKLANIEGTDLLSLMLRAERDIPDAISEDMIVNECVSFLMAGQDTTAATLTWTVHHLSKNKEVQKRLQAEVDSVLCGRAVTEDDIPKLKYTKQIFEEVLRLNPPSPTLSRLCTKDQELCGKFIPAGTSVVVLLNGVALSDDHWNDAQMFNPDRFSDDAKQTQRHSYATVPFSAGSRNCIGQKFATQEYIILLSSLVQNYEFETCQDSDQFTVRFEIAPVPVGLKARFVARKKTL